MLFYISVFLFILIIFGIAIFLCYWIPKKFGFPKTGKILAWIAGFSIVILIGTFIFEDQFFTKSNAKNFLFQQGIILNDDFEIMENKSMWGPGDYYNTFSLKISTKDRLRLIKEISSAVNFKIINKSEEDDIQKMKSDKIIQNYETETQFVRTYFEPSSGNYAPVYRKIEIDKKKDLLIFEDIEE
ncbi:hypothetical protein [Pedobacter nutrimenti]|uniref:Uncharacterized protein n=1 Tax=Pedobacter nutrimenti TaxID=1241337 RepID=A0A318UCC3_9SPHI|nr:hypothetical protein [Pedobacter nutrimenti]PYF74024.1 hypothetical protein B0O44_104194 [Pedobacter nutrimenti]